MRYKSPLRYPGGKAKLAPFLKTFFEVNNLCDGHYAEPYAGGAGLALSLLYDEYARHVHVNDFDRAVYAFWHSALTRTDDFCHLIMTRPLTTTEWTRQREVYAHKEAADLFELGFAAFYLNRTSRSGIIASGGMIGGNDQKGTWKLDARFNRTELTSRLRRVGSYRRRISLTHEDAISFLAGMIDYLPDKSLTYCDPPYFVKGQQRLYANYYKAADHDEVAATLESYPFRWIVSYDHAPEIVTLYQRHRCVVYDLYYSAATRYDGAEAMFFSDDVVIPSLARLSDLAAARE
jgi:DNA adenine methylase